MNEIDLADAFTNNIGVIMAFFMAYLSATSAFLAVAYIAASEIPTVLSRLIVSIYILASVFMGVSFQRTLEFAISLREQMRLQEMLWHPAVSEPAWLLVSASWVGVAVMVLIFVASIVFYFHARRPAASNPVEQTH